MRSSSDLSVKFVNMASSNNNTVGLVEAGQWRCDVSISTGSLRLGNGDLVYLSLRVGISPVPFH